MAPPIIFTVWQQDISTEEEDGSGSLAGNIGIFVVSAAVVLHAAFISYSVLPRVEGEDIAEQ